MSEKAKGIVAEFKKLDGERAPILTEFEHIAKYILPSHAYFVDQKTTDGNESKYIDVYDTTAMRANEVLSAFLHGAIAPPGAQWFKGKERDKDKDKVPSVRKWFEQVVNPRMQAAIEESNFVTSFAQLLLDLGAFCTAGLWLDDESTGMAFGRLRFRNIHLKKLVFREGVDGRAGYVWMKTPISAANAVAMYPEADMPKVRDAYGSDKHKHKEFDFIIYSEPATDSKGSLTGLYETTIVSVEDETEVDSIEELAQPFMIPRWQQATGQVWGTGPGMRALPDVLVLNRAKELELGAWEETVNRGYMTTPDNLVDNEIDRRGVTFVNDVNNLRPLNEGDFSWSVAQLKGEEVQNSIRSLFYEDRLVMPTTSGDTATEFRIRYDLLQRQLAPTMGRLQTELLNPLIERIFTLMDAGGEFGDWPEELGDKVDFDIEYVSPLSKAQNGPRVDAYNNWLSIVTGLATSVYPELRNLPNIEQSMRDLAESMDVPSSGIHTEEEYKRKNEEDQQRAQEMAQQEAMSAQQ